MRRHHLSPVLMALFTGLLHLSSPRTASAAPPTITVVSPTPGAVVGDSVNVQVQIQSGYQITTVTAQTAFGTANLTKGSSSTWSGAVPLKGAAFGDQTISVTATYSLNQQVTAQVTALHDLPPTVTVGASLGGTVTTGALPVDASCTDDSPTPCTIEVLYRGQSIASGPSPFKKTVSLASFAASSFTNEATRDLKVRARDSSGQATDIPAEVWVLPPQPGRVEVDQVPAGQIIDYNEGWILYQTADGLNNIHLYSRKSKQEVFSGPSKKGGYLTPNGVLLLDYAFAPEGPNTPFFIHEWKAGTLTTWNQTTTGSIVVRGQYAAFNEIDDTDPTNPTCILHRRDLLTGADTIVYQETGCDPELSMPMGPRAIAPNGDVYFQVNITSPGTSSKAVLYRYVAATGKSEWVSGACAPGISTVADDHLVVFYCADYGWWSTASQLYLRDLATPDSIELYRSDTGFSGNFAVANGWAAYDRQEDGVAQVWRRYPDGGQEQVSAFLEESGLISLGPNGEVTFSHGDEMWTSVPGAEPVPGAPYRFINGKAYFKAGRSLFLEDGLTGGGSTGTGAGGESGTGGAGGESGTGGASSASGTGGESGTGDASSASGAGTTASASGTGGSGTGGSADTGAGISSGEGASLGCSVSGERGADAGLFGLGLVGLAALGARRRGRSCR